MSERLLQPADAAKALARHLEHSWAERIYAELVGEAERPFAVSLRPGISGSASVERVGIPAWHEWRTAWRNAGLTDLKGVRLEESRINVAGRTTVEPRRLHIDSLAAGIRALAHFAASPLEEDVDRARKVGARLRDTGAILTPGTLRTVCRLSDADVDVAVDVAAWLREHEDLSGWTSRQLPVPGMHTKWLSGHRQLIAALVDRDPAVETRPRLSVIHFTYVDPDYLATGGRRHDAWTTGDSHELAYLPRNVLIVENRDCRLWFPGLADTVVVEGGGMAAAVLLGGIDWITGARIVYWGDIDSDGFAILDNLRSEMSPRGVSVESILMDEATRVRYVHLGVDRDRTGKLLQPSTARLANLTPEEADCYAAIATSGPAATRRIEQERIDLADARRALCRLLAGQPGSDSRPRSPRLHSGTG
ncbi:Wadjet anti-phage system protein JetD domain-containing protein [Microbacterium sp. B35-30]|uniref:Wadjet anti-phage system protein JetD domain-containing protein n=1 Tax=Microbacterium sp. B35-30 TaxID=1962642 RepID=UPI0013D32627|nr:Wadjet anti-phage system protein JetD domain-containing protein [Microbacterium sp. B35-30]KAF2415705.1 hypothetical protein B2K11_18930 [Microbacterium sp. B35-30]